VADDGAPATDDAGNALPKVAHLVPADLCPAYTFENFVAGKSNQLAHAAALRTVK